MRMSRERESVCCAAENQLLFRHGKELGPSDEGKTLLDMDMHTGGKTTAGANVMLHSFSGGYEMTHCHRTGRGDSMLLAQCVLGPADISSAAPQAERHGLIIFCSFMIRLLQTLPLVTI
jgi:hypothetical protein